MFYNRAFRGQLTQLSTATVRGESNKSNKHCLLFSFHLFYICSLEYEPCLNFCICEKECATVQADFAFV